MDVLIELFITFLKIGTLSFGGGYAAIGVIQSEIINAHHWIDLKTFSDIITISQMTPGPIGINAATFIGINMAGLVGGIVATIGFVIPSFIIVSILGEVYLRYGNLTIIKVVLQGMRPVIIGVIAAAGATLLVAAIFKGAAVSMQNLLPIQVLLVGFSFWYLVFKKQGSVITVMILAGVLNLVIDFVLKLM